uniref:Proline-, glutamic acid-and leucine-rich protein 1 n=1 Tax=Anthurium amnicola TaxID=1678845 RepID=A0A1D1ZJE1_9ARAE
MDFLEDANDAWLKPRLLRSLVRDRLPDEGRPIPGPSQLSSILSLLRVHGLLSESLPPGAAAPADANKLAGAWRAAVDAWVERCLALVSSKMPDKRWAGICLLGLTCEMCDSDRFVSSYSVWFQALLPNIQPPVDSRLVKMASCASMSDLFMRLSTFPNVKKDATSLASKLIPSILQLLNDDGPDDILVEALNLFATLMNFFPFAVHRHYKEVEKGVVSKVTSHKCTIDVSKKLLHCLVLLPKVRGDADSLVIMMRKILGLINLYLTAAFEGLEEESRSTETMRLSDPPENDPLPSLGDQSFSSVAPEQATKSIQEMVLPRVHTLIQWCCIMVTNPYPVQVTLPVRPLMSLVERVLSVNGSLHETLSSFTSELHQEVICSELPVLHLNCLDLLTSVIKALRSQLFPYAANVVRILMEYFKGAILPCLRIKVYSILQVLLTSMGVGMAIYLAEEVIKNAFADLNPLRNESNLGSSNLGNSKVAEPARHSSNRKRKHVSAAPKERQIGVDLGKIQASRKLTAPLSVQIAALGTLEALITVAGSLRAEHWRPDVDKLLLSVASNACSVGWAKETQNMVEWESSPSQADFQLAALHALLASFLSHAHVRPPYLSQGLELFRRGKQEMGTKVAAFCTHSLLALEVLIHPRFLPLTDLVTKSSGYSEVPNHQPYSMFAGRQISNLSSLSKDNHRVANDFGLDEDDPYRWLDDREEISVGVSNRDEHMEDVDKLGGTVQEPSPERVPLVTSVDSHQVEEGSVDPTGSADIGHGEVPPGKGVANSDMFPGTEIALDMGIDPASDDKAFLHEDVDALVRHSNLSNEGKTVSYDSDSSLDSLPDIVDADPDSD